MAQPSWSKTLAEVLNHPTKKIEKISERTGNAYEVDVIPRLQAYSTGNCEVVTKEDGTKAYRYSIVDREYEYTIKVPTEIKNLTFGMILEFTNVLGGSTAHGGWYSADTVSVVQKNGG